MNFVSFIYTLVFKRVPDGTSQTLSVESSEAETIHLASGLKTTSVSCSSCPSNFRTTFLPTTSTTSIEKSDRPTARSELER